MVTLRARAVEKRLIVRLFSAARQQHKRDPSVIHNFEEVRGPLKKIWDKIPDSDKLAVHGLAEWQHAGDLLASATPG